ncbi:MAG: hypothetical protein CVV11_13180 [Gammaproteobacteria bacterium HGW-Gammaproteobacteria-15]|nr:MAG: hypothetical protein CVV11_13180 [Gammaproteobacteria bacterium HGW-Gammaproteobacteria-15]
MKNIYLVLFIMALLSVVDVAIWSFPNFFSVSAYLKVAVLAGLAYSSHTDMDYADNSEPTLNFRYISEMIFLLFFSLWFALLHHANVDYISKASGFGFIAGAFAMFSLIVVFVEKLMFGGIWQKLTLLSMKIFMYSLLVLGGCLLVFGEWRWELIFLFDLF